MRPVSKLVDSLTNFLGSVRGETAGFAVGHVNSNPAGVSEGFTKKLRDDTAPLRLEKYSVMSLEENRW